MSPTSLQPSLLIHLQATAFKIKNKVQNDKYYLFSNIVALFVALAVVLVVVALVVVTVAGVVTFVAEAAVVVPFPTVVVVGMVVVVVAGLILGKTSLGTAAPWLNIGAYD